MRNFLWSPWANPRIEELKPGPAPHFYLVGGLEHYFFSIYIYILGMSSSQLTNFIVFQRGRSTTNQLRWKASRVSWRSNPIQSNPMPESFWSKGFCGVFFFHYELIHVCFGHGLIGLLVISCYIMLYQLYPKNAHGLYHAISCYIMLYQLYPEMPPMIEISIHQYFYHVFLSINSKW